MATTGIEVRAVARNIRISPQKVRLVLRTINGKPVHEAEAILRYLPHKAAGPIGKLLTLQLLPEYVDTVRDGRVEIRIDDPDNNAGDGYAFDFVRLLVNPKGYAYTGTVRGIAVDTAAGRPLAEERFGPPGERVGLVILEWACQGSGVEERVG